jgi:hypothetical protein
MGALISLPFRLLNLILPFTRSGTPLAQDLIHTAILFGTLYFAPQIAEWYTAQQQRPGQAEDRIEGTENTERVEQERRQEEEEPPLDEHLVLQHDGINAVGEAARPPPAPTPPPQNLQAHVADEPEPEPQPQLHPGQGAQELPDEAFAPGPVNPPPRPPPTNRTIGTKKAKSLARRDQQRAYNEWIRSEAERRKLEEAEGRDEREAALASERARRAGIEAEIREREREERERRKEEQQKEADEEAARRERVVKSVREKMEQGGAANLVDEAIGEGKDVLWVERLVRASGLMQQSQQEGSHIMVTGGNWLVRIDAEVMQRAYEQAERVGEGNGGKIGFEELGGLLEKAVLARATA